MKNLLKMSDLSREDIIEILNLADQLKYELKHNIPHRHLGYDLPEVLHTYPCFL